MRTDYRINIFKKVSYSTVFFILQITLVSCLAAIAMAAPEPQLGYGLGYGGGVVSSVPAACTPSTEEIEIQSCAPTAETICSTADVVSEEITYEKRYVTHFSLSQIFIHFVIFEQVSIHFKTL